MNSPDFRTILSSVISALERLKIPYFVGGSVASSALGLPRATLDIDIVADIPAAEAPRLAEAFRGAFYVDQAQILAAIERRSSFNIIHSETAHKVDIFIIKDRGYDREALSRRRRVQLFEGEGSLRCYLASPEDIILSKLEWYKNGGRVSERQWLDVQGVMKVQGQQLDTAYLKKWALKLSLSELLDSALSEAGIA
ncbi:MAG: hypothetical protein AB1715_02585 [Acidobacteriota bacterium]